MKGRSADGCDTRGMDEFIFELAHLGGGNVRRVHLRIHGKLARRIRESGIQLGRKVVRSQEGFEFGNIVLDDRHNSAGSNIELCWGDQGW